MRDFRFHFCCFSCCCYFVVGALGEAYGRAPLSAAAAKAAVAVVVVFWGFPKKKWNTMKKTTTKATATTTRCLVSLEGNRAQLPVSRRLRRRRYDITRRRSRRRCRYRCCCGGKLNTNFWLGFLPAAASVAAFSLLQHEEKCFFLGQLKNEKQKKLWIVQSATEKRE